MTDEDLGRTPEAMQFKVRARIALIARRVWRGKHLRSRRDLVVGASLFFTSFLVFKFSPIHHMVDSRYEMLFSQHLLWHHSFSVPAQVIQKLESRQPGQVHQCCTDLPYQLVQVGERFYHYYPPGNIILPMPYVALANAMGISAVGPDGKHDPLGDTRIQKGLASVLMAGLTLIIFFTARLILSLPWSWLIATATAYGTQVWSTASRTMWSHTFGIFILSVVVWLIVRTEAKKTPLPAVFLASCLAWLYFIRPTFVLSIFAITIYVLLYHRAILPRFVFTGAIWLAAFVAYSKMHFGQLQTSYYSMYKSGSGETFWERLAGTLISPSRGLLIYVPILAMVIYLLLRYYRASNYRLLSLAGAIVISHLIMIARFVGWHGGPTYGSRLFTDVVPWFALLGILAVQSRLSCPASFARDSQRRVRIEAAVATVLLALSIIVNGIGAISVSANLWNEPMKMSYQQWLKNLWDWRHPQFLGLPRSWAAQVPTTAGEAAETGSVRNPVFIHSDRSN